MFGGFEMIKHDSMRGYFAYELYQQMKKKNNIWLLVGDLGYKVFDSIRDDFPDRFINVGASEQSLLDISCGLALEGKIPFVYSITTFLLYRPFETIRNYINHEEIPVRLIGSGRDKDYAHDGFSHWSEDTEGLFTQANIDNRPGSTQYYLPGIFGNINPYWPETKEEIPGIVNDMIKSDKPSFLSLRR